MLPYSEIYSLNLLLESQGEKKETEAFEKEASTGEKKRDSTGETACLGDPQAAGKRHSQPFSQKRLPLAAAAAAAAATATAVATAVAAATAAATVAGCTAKSGSPQAWRASRCFPRPC